MLLWSQDALATAPREWIPSVEVTCGVAALAREPLALDPKPPLPDKNFRWGCCTIRFQHGISQFLSFMTMRDGKISDYTSLYSQD